MKNLYKLLAIIALIAVIGFAFTACEQPAETSTLTGITADYTGGSIAINTDVNSLKSSLTVTAKYSDNTSKTLNAADYSLSGDLSASGQKTVTVTYEGETTTFNVTVTAAANNDITYTATQTGGADGTTDSTGIVFTFSASVDSLNLSAADITVSGAAAKGASVTLTGTGTSLTLAPITVNAAGLATVAIAKDGIEAETKHVTVYKAGESAPTLTGITAVYNGTTAIYPTTPLNDLKANLTVKVQYSDGSEYTLSEHEYNLDGTLTVGTSTITITYEGETTTFNVTVTATPNSDITYTAAQTGGTDDIADSTGIVFTFSASVDSLNLTAADITVSGAAAKGASAALTGTGTSLTLAPITVNAAGLATVTIAKEGIEAVQKSVTIYKAGVYVPEYWSITWNLNGGAEGTGAYPTQIEKGTVLSRPSPDPTKTGGTFGGWYSDSSLAQPYTFANPVTADLNLYARWVGIVIAPTITTTSLPNGAVGTAYSHTLTATGTTPTWSYESGELPDGLSLSSAGVISGTPTIVGTSPFTVKAANAAGSDSKQLSITITPSGVNIAEAIPLTENIWADGNLPTSSDVQWFSFIATASTQYIHAAFNTLSIISGMYVQVYDSSGTTTVGSEERLYDPSRRIYLQSLASGQTYYIRVRPSSNVSGTYRIGFNASTIPPGAIPLTENLWADGNITRINEHQWFTFTATASTQYIHFVPGTLNTNLNVQVYNSSGTTVGSETTFDSLSISRTLTAGQRYYIRARPDSGGGTYRIGFNASTAAPPVQLPPNAIQLFANQWAEGNLPTSSDVQWFTFTATASTQYLHFDTTGTLNRVYVQVYDSSGAAVGSQTTMYSSTLSISRTLTTGQTYYIRVIPDSSTGSGTYRIAFNTTVYPPGTSFIPLTANQWADGNLPTLSDVQWFTFTATASMQYIHFEPGTLSDLGMQVYDSNGATVGSEAGFSANKYISRTLTEGQTYYIRVRPPYNSSGTYRIGFNASIIAPGINPIPLTENQWADGILPTSSDVQWFTFTATASTQYIYFKPGTLTNLYVQVYDSSVSAVGSETNLSTSTTSTTFTSLSLTTEQTYYIRVRPYNSSFSGTYRIGFNASFAPPGAVPLTANVWADGSLPTYNDLEWFVFTATANYQYIHVDFGTLTELYVQVYDSSGGMVGSRSSFSGSGRASNTLTSGQTYYILSSGSSGTYQIAFNASTTAPPVQLPSNAIPLTADQWADGSIPTSSDVQWFTFTATASAQYIHIEFGTLDRLYVRVYDSSGVAVGSETNLSSSTTRTLQSLTNGQTYYIRVRPYGSRSGTYRIGFNTSTTAPQ